MRFATQSQHPADLTTAHILTPVCSPYARSQIDVELSSSSRIFHPVKPRRGDAHSMVMTETGPPRPSSTQKTPNIILAHECSCGPSPKIRPDKQAQSSTSVGKEPGIGMGGPQHPRTHLAAPKMFPRENDSTTKEIFLRSRSEEPITHFVHGGATKRGFAKFVNNGPLFREGGGVVANKTCFVLESTRSPLISIKKKKGVSEAMIVKMTYRSTPSRNSDLRYGCTGASRQSQSRTSFDPHRATCFATRRGKRGQERNGQKGLRGNESRWKFGGTGRAQHRYKLPRKQVYVCSSSSASEKGQGRNSCPSVCDRFAAVWS
jgi:hypothetical protein